eukprot:2934257-Rhodomonas_salina.2
MLGKCKALAHLDSSDNEIRAEGAGMLAGIGGKGAWVLARVLGECKALAHFNLSGNGMVSEGAALLKSVLEYDSASLAIDIDDDGAGLMVENGTEGLGKILRLECQGVGWGIAGLTQAWQ